MTKPVTNSPTLANPLTDADVSLIAARANAARTLLAGNFAPGEHAEYEQAEKDLAELVNHDVDRLLCAIEETGVDHDTGYVAGLRAAVSWLRAFDQDVPDLDRATCVRLATGMAAVAESAAQRLGVG